MTAQIQSYMHVFTVISATGDKPLGSPNVDLIFKQTCTHGSALIHSSIKNSITIKLN